MRKQADLTKPIGGKEDISDVSAQCLEAVRIFFEWKQMYDQQTREWRSEQRHRQQRRSHGPYLAPARQGALRWKGEGPFCVRCGEQGGCAFQTTSVPIDTEEGLPATILHFTAECLHRPTPCDLRMDIRLVVMDLHHTKEVLRARMQQIKDDIIRYKNLLLFGLIAEETAVERFEEWKAELETSVEQLMAVEQAHVEQLDRFYVRADHPLSRDNILAPDHPYVSRQGEIRRREDMQRHYLADLRDLLAPCACAAEEQDRRIRQAVELYHNQLMPLVAELRELRWAEWIITWPMNGESSVHRYPSRPQAGFVYLEGCRVDHCSPNITTFRPPRLSSAATDSTTSSFSSARTRRAKKEQEEEEREEEEEEEEEKEREKERQTEEDDNGHISMVSLPDTVVLGDEDEDDEDEEDGEKDRVEEATDAATKSATAAAFLGSLPLTEAAMPSALPSSFAMGSAVDPSTALDAMIASAKSLPIQQPSTLAHLAQPPSSGWMMTTGNPPLAATTTTAMLSMPLSTPPTTLQPMIPMSIAAPNTTAVQPSLFARTALQQPSVRIPGTMPAASVLRETSYIVPTPAERHVVPSIFRTPTTNASTVGLPSFASATASSMTPSSSTSATASFMSGGGGRSSGGSGSIKIIRA